MREEKKICPGNDVAKVEGPWSGGKGLDYKKALNANLGCLDFPQRERRAMEGFQAGE